MLKGKRSEYESERIRRGAPSRKRKRAFNLYKLEAIWLEKALLSKGLGHGWIALFQEGMRNADGSNRRAKYRVDVSRIPYESRLYSI